MRALEQLEGTEGVVAEALEASKVLAMATAVEKTPEQLARTE